MAEAQSVEECQAHIQEVRRSNGVDLNNNGSNKLLRGYESMLKLLSAQLYSDPAHFIYELIQNADDNTYPRNVQPQAVLAYRQDGLFFFGCNEVGFTKANIEAICDIDQSTKTLNKGQEGYIGEKGIGFKSVFKVASEVWVTSNNYSFKFDKSQLLGIITPTWDGFPHLPKELRTNTMFCIKIDNQEDRDIVKEQLSTILEPSSLMFLRRLSKIKIVKLDHDGNIFDEVTMSYSPSKYKGMNLMVTTKTKDASTGSSAYVFSEYLVQNMPAAEQRPGVTQSSIKLAFPINGKCQPVIANQNLHAFLPVCSSGLPFLVHADFLLVASRQNIDESQSWNRHLQDGLARALLQAVTEFNATGLRYLWPKYLPKTSVPLKFLGDAVAKFLKIARDAKILEARSGTLAEPNLMILVPDRFKDGNGVPLLTSFDDRYLSSKYDQNGLSALITQTLDGAKFLVLLKDYLILQEDEFRDRPGSWHSKICEILLSESRRHDMMEFLLLPIAPLSDGTWTHMRNPSIGYGRRKNRPRVTLYLPPTAMNIRIPNFVSLPVISHEAAGDVHRLEFYKKFGAEELSHRNVLDSILKQHQDGIPNADAPLLLSHAEYIFSSRFWLDSKDLSTTLWVADHCSSHRRGSDLHMDMPDSKKHRKDVSVYFPEDPTVAKFIHPSYLESFQDDPETRKKWLAWLQERLGVHVIPRLRNKSSNGLSEEFEWIIKNVPSCEWLVCLKHHWADYALDVSSMSKVRKELGDALVACTDGALVKLRDTTLPSLRSSFGSLPTSGFHFVDLPQQEDEDWRKLSHFGVITSRDLKFCIEILTNYSQNAAEPSEEEVVGLYKEIEGSCQKNPASREVTKSAFSKNPLIYLHGKWLSMEVCVWESPKCLHKIMPVASRLLSVKALFRDFLALPNASVCHFVKELLDLGGNMEEVDRITKILLELSARLHLEATYDLAPLNRCKMFPITSSKGNSHLAHSTKVWYIPDRPDLKESFMSALSLLDFDPDGHQKLRPLLDRMNLERRLSKNVSEEIVVVGKEQADKDEDQTKYLQDRAHYLSCLTDAQDGRKLKSLTVWIAESILIRRSVLVNKQKIRGKDDFASLVIEEDLRLFVSAEKPTLDAVDLNDGLADFVKFPSEHKDTVQQILILSSNDRIEKQLIKKDIKFETAKEYDQIDQSLDGPTEEAIASQLQRSQAQVEATAALFSTQPLKPDTNDDSVSASTSVQEKKPEYTSTRPNLPGRSRGAENRSAWLQHVSRATTRPPFMHGSLGEKTVRAHKLSTTQDTLSRPMYPSDQRTRSGASPYSVPSVSLGAMNKIVDEAEPDHDVSSSSHRTRSITPEGHTCDDPEAISFGEKGERKMYIFLKELLDDHFTDSMWTSHVRGQYTDLPFEENESDFADFTVPDSSGRLTKWLAGRGCQQAENWMSERGAEGITYHIEVKCTAGSSTEGFHMSQNQIEMASRYQISDTDVPADVYVILRVCNLTGNGGNAYVHPFIDPWNMLAQGMLVSTAPRGYIIHWLG